MDRQHIDKLDMRNLDPRVVRTRRLLIDSFDALRKENKSLRSLSVLDITKRAGVNRVTFYAHFIDKYELLDIWKRDMFSRAYQNSVNNGDISTEAKLHNLIDVVLDFMDIYNESKKPTNKQFEPLLEAAIQQELKRILLQIVESTSPDTTATFLSWALFGSANDWSRNKTIEKREVAKQIMILVQNILQDSIA